MGERRWRLCVTTAVFAAPASAHASGGILILYVMLAMTLPPPLIVLLLSSKAGWRARCAGVLAAWLCATLLLYLLFTNSSWPSPWREWFSAYGQMALWACPLVAVCCGWCVMRLMKAKTQAREPS